MLMLCLVTPLQLFLSALHPLFVCVVYSIMIYIGIGGEDKMRPLHTTRIRRLTAPLHTVYWPAVNELLSCREQGWSHGHIVWHLSNRQH